MSFYVSGCSTFLGESFCDLLAILWITIVVKSLVLKRKKKKEEIPGVIDEISSEAKKGILQLLMNSLY